MKKMQLQTVHKNFAEVNTDSLGSDTDVNCSEC